MSNKELKTSEQWIKIKNQENYPISTIVLEANGWDQDNLENSWNEPISKIEFDLRLTKSKVSYQNLQTDGVDKDYHDHVPGRD